jgi:hypothetical protein
MSLREKKFFNPNTPNPHSQMARSIEYGQVRTRSRKEIELALMRNNSSSVCVSGAILSSLRRGEHWEGDDLRPRLGLGGLGVLLCWRHLRWRLENVGWGER